MRPSQQQRTHLLWLEGNNELLPSISIDCRQTLHWSLEDLRLFDSIVSRLLDSYIPDQLQKRIVIETDPKGRGQKGER